MDRRTTSRSAECAGDRTVPEQVVVTGPGRLAGAIVASRLLGGLAAGCLLAGILGTALNGDQAAAHVENWVIAIACSLLGLRVIGHVPRNATGWLLLGMGVCAAVTVGTTAWPSVPGVVWIGICLGWFAFTLVPVLALVFPTGRPVSGWWWPVLGVSVAGAVTVSVGLGWAAWSAPTTFWDRVGEGNGPTGWVLELITLGLLGGQIGLFAAVGAQLLRWWRASGNQRWLMGWAIICTVFLVVADTQGAPGSVSWAWVVSGTALPAAVVIAITRYRLYDIDLLIHRSLLYASLAVLLISLYAGVVLLASAWFPHRGFAVHAAGTVTAVLAVAPLRQVLQSWLDRWLYGDRARPYDVLSRLGQRLEHSLAPAGVFPTIAAGVAEALKLPYVAVHLGSGADARVFAEYGRSRGWPQTRIAMTHRGTVVGELVAEARSAEERFGRRERRLLADLGRHAAPAAQAVQLTEDLRQARERLVRSREEERLRIRRDIHDGIGPSIAGVRMQLAAVRKLLDRTDSRASELLDQAISSINSTSSEVRHLVDGLRPPILDLGLVTAIREEAARFTGPSLTVEVTADPDLESLPAAVEVAAYRIVAEALTNVVRHSRARYCHINLRHTSDLELEIVDDGQGIPSRASRGVGLASMRERCAELGGRCTITQAHPCGTRLVARIPLLPADDRKPAVSDSLVRE